jgi:NAD(P)-dependent dehydrogenase (short-subunit alcohol dehydrogenase family)
VVRVAVVTGAARGIGAATCAALRADGFEVLGLDLAGVELAADVTDPASVAAALAGIPRIDVLVNNAGILIEAPLATMALADFDRQVAVNLRGPFIVTQERCRRSRKAGASSTSPPSLPISGARAPRPMRPPRARSCRSRGPGRGNWRPASSSTRSPPARWTRRFWAMTP